MREAVSRLVAEGVLEVAPARIIRVPVMGTQAFRALAETRIAVEGIDILRIAGGKVVERWTQPDDLRLYQQIGVVPTVQPRY